MSGDGYIVIIVIGLILAAITLIAMQQHEDLEEAYTEHVERTTKK